MTLNDFYEKLLLILFISLGLIGCSSTAPLSTTPLTPLQVEVGSESYNWKYWNCYDFFDDRYILTIGYIPELELDGYHSGKLFLKDADSPIDTVYQLKGIQHRWDWDSYAIVIQSDRTGLFYDFTGAKSGEERTSKEVYKCYN